MSPPEPLRPVRLVPLLAVVAAVLVVAGSAAVWVDHVVRSRREDPLGPLLVARLLDLNGEGNIPTWFSSALLLLLALGFATSAAVGPRAARPAYVVLAAAAALLSLDETAAVHEAGAKGGAALAGGADRLSTYAWVLPGLAVAALAGGALLLLAQRLPRAQRIDLVRAGMVYLTGVLALEAATGGLVSREDVGAIVLLSVVEEGLELAGILLALAAVLRPLRVQVTAPGVVVVTRDD